MLVLFDIDGTLLSIVRRGANVFAQALERVYGTSGPIDRYSFAGKTDHQITFELLTCAGRRQSEIEAALPSFKDCYFEMLEETIGSSGMEVLPGVVELLDQLQADETVVLGLQTGNWEAAAEIKLGLHDLGGYFVAGGFGDGHLDRSALPMVARERAQVRLGSAIDLRHTVIVGDTALDVACAQKWKMASVAVATGGTNQRELSAAGADLVVPSLADLSAERLLELVSARDPMRPSAVGDNAGERR